MNNLEGTANMIANGLTSYLKKNGQEELLPKIIKLLQSRSSNQKGIEIVTPVKLTNIQQKKATKFARNLTKMEKTKISFKTDPDILDGIRIITNDNLWDLSVKGELESILKNKNI